MKLRDRVASWISSRSLENPASSLANPANWLFEGLGATPSSSGIVVTPQSALNQSTVFACVRVLASTIATLPFPLYERTATGRDRAVAHPLYKLLHDRPNPEMSAVTFWEALIAHQETWGNAYAEIERDNAGRVLNLWPLLPDRTRAERHNGVKLFITRGPNGQNVALSADRVLHLPGLGFDGLSGYSVVNQMRQSIGLAMATEEYGGKLFANGAKAGVLLKHPGKLSPEAATRLKTSWDQMHSGLSNAHRTAVLEEGMDAVSVGIPPDDAQFLQTRQLQREEIAGWFGVPAHMIGAPSGGSNNHEQQAITFAVHTIRPRCVRNESIINYDLLPENERERYYAKHDLDGLLRGDTAAQVAKWKELGAMGVLSINDIRTALDLNPVAGGEQRFVAMNMVPLEKAGEFAQAQIDKQKQPTNPAVQPGGVPDTGAGQIVGKGARSTVAPETMQAAKSFERVFRKCADDVLRREISAMRRALKKSNGARDSVGFRTWMDEFYSEQPSVIRKAFEPAVSCFLDVIGGSESGILASEIVEQLATRETETSRTALAALLTHDEPEAGIETLLSQWEATRADDVARHSIRFAA